MNFSEEVYYMTDSPMWKYVAPLLIPVGVIENIISIIILSGKKFKMMPSRRTLIYLSVCDSLILLVGLLRYWFVAMFKIHPNELSSFACKSLSFLVFFTSHSSAGLVGLISIERVIVVMTPSWLKVQSAKIDKYGGPITFLIIILFNLHVPFTTDLIPNPHFNNSLPPASGLHYNICVSSSLTISFVVDVMDTTLLFYLPFIFILSCNLAIICHMRMSTRRLSSTAGSSQYSQTARLPDTPAELSPGQQILLNTDEAKASPPAEQTITPRRFSIFRMGTLSRQSTRRRTSKRRDTRVTNTLLLVTSMFLVCNLPFSIIHVIRTRFEYNNTDAWDQAWLIAYVLVFVNNCLNFPIYIISQPLFRKEVIRICKTDKPSDKATSCRRSGVGKSGFE